MKDRPKLSVDDQIEHMKALGIKFEIMHEEEAKDFLTYNTYFFKIKSYAKNYEKYINEPNRGKYINLDFAYLVELSRIDFHLSRFILKLVLDIEHALKVQLIRDLTDNPDEDGYQIVQNYFKAFQTVEQKIKKTDSDSACLNLRDKHYPNCPIWMLVEMLTFGDFIYLYQFYYSSYPSKTSNTKNLWSVRFLRNATAHCNCLINSLKVPYGDSKKRINISKYGVSKLGQIKGLSERSIKNNMSNPVINDFIVTLMVYNDIVTSEGMRKNRLSELEDLLSNRILKNKTYFSKNNTLKASYEFVQKSILHIFS